MTSAARTDAPTDLVILAGQSNMRGQWVKRQQLSREGRGCPNAEIRVGDTWLPLRMGSAYQPRGIGPEVAFARRWTELTQRPLRVVKVSRSGAGLRLHYNPFAPGPATKKLLRQSSEALHSGAHRLCGLIWFQGEEDAKYSDDASAYAQRLSVLLFRLRTTLNSPNLPVVVARLSLHNDKMPHGDLVNAAFDAMAWQGVHQLRSDDLTKLDGIHFDHKGLETLGQRAADCLYATQKLPDSGGGGN